MTQSNILIDKASLVISKLENKKKIIKEPEYPYIHFKHIAPPSVNLKEEQDLEQLPHDRLPTITSGWRERNDNSHIGKNSNSITSVLKKIPKLNSSEKEDVESYTGKKGRGSGEINNTLLKPKSPIHYSEYGFAKRLHKATSRPIGHNINLYSGVYSDPRKWQKESDGSTKLRAFTSLTHDKKTAHVFAHQWSEGKKASPEGKKGKIHIIHLHAKANDLGLPVMKHSDFEEHETVLPPDTHIKPHPDYVNDKGVHEPEIHTGSDGTKIHIHHYVIHSQTHPDNYRPANKVY
jgi:hypothetical protein